MDHGINKKGNQNMHSNKWKWKHDNPKSMEVTKSNAKWEVHSNTSLPKESKEVSNK